jgi:hypothetical protein
MRDCDLSPGGLSSYAVGLVCELLLDLVGFGKISRGFSHAQYCSAFLEEIFDVLVEIMV